ncbi:MAG: glycosyltransferase family 2 protein [Acidobacteriota bacterium]
MKLSVIVPTHDTRELTLSCLAALRQAGGGGVELVVVDDGGSDGTDAAVREVEPQARVLHWDQAVGFTVAVNRGAELTGGDLLLFLNSDTALDPGALDRLAAAFAANPRLGVAGAALRYPDGRRQWSGGRAPGLLWFFLLGSGFAELISPLRPRRDAGPAPSVDWVSGAALAVRAVTWRELGPFDPRLRFYAQDLDLCLRAAAAGWEVRLLAEFGVVHHHGASVSRQPGAAVVRHPEWLFRDLLRWAEKAHDEIWRRRAAWCLGVGTTLRLAARALRRPFQAATNRPAYDQTTAAWSEARRAVRPFRAAGPAG